MAELSGGVDSSSIVCLADNILAKEVGVTPGLHTLSYFHDNEPSCDERPHFEVIEKARGSIGSHLDAARYDTLRLDLPHYVPIPIYPQGFIDAEHDVADIMRKSSARNLLSGIGGDEFLGGVPTGIPELSDLFHEHDFSSFLRSCASWSIANRVSRWGLIKEAAMLSFRRQIQDSPYFAGTAPSVVSTSFSQYLQSLERRQVSLRPGVKPSQIAFIDTWLGILRQLASTPVPIFGSYTRSYPYLDRDLLTFLLNIPRSQVIRPGERRSLMRRALSQVVPKEILWRKNKATASRRYVRAYLSLSSEIREMIKASPLVDAGYVDYDNFTASLGKACDGLMMHSQPIMRTIALEAWFRAAAAYLEKPERKFEKEVKRSFRISTGASHGVPA
jgi:asparagine synthase (glutamine-hydrolysing)